MNVQFLSNGSDYRARGGGGTRAKTRRDESLFWWTILITLLMALATFCWVFSILVFKYPEKPFCYQLLSKLDKLEELKSFDPLSVPQGTFYGPRDLLSKYYQYNPEQLRMVNAMLKRSYITNYASESPVYVKGEFIVTSFRPLTDADLMGKGWVVRAKSKDFEDVSVEVLLPGAANDVQPYKDGELFTLDTKSSFVSVVNVQRDMEADGLTATVVPIVYGKFNGSETGDRKLALVPPVRLNMEGALPLTTAQQQSEPVTVAIKVEN